MRHRVPFLIALVAFAGCAPAEHARVAVDGPPVAPLSALDGTRTDLGAVVRGHPALVSLWATWCDACVGETRALNQLEERARSLGGALVVGVAVGESRATVGAFAGRHRLEYPLFVDEEFRVADALGERRVPATIVFDRRGKIVFRGGALDGASLAAFRHVLAEK
jgi:peroxiredoxin